MEQNVNVDVKTTQKLITGHCGGSMSLKMGAYSERLYDEGSESRLCPQPPPQCRQWGLGQSPHEAKRILYKS